MQSDRTISDVVAKETAKHSLGEFQVKGLFPQDNEKFKRRSHAMSAPQNSCVAFNSLHPSRFAKGTMSTGSCSPLVEWPGVEQASRCCYVDADDWAQDCNPLSL